MAASVVRDSITWPQGSISHETAQFGRFTDLDVMPRIAKNEASPNALRPVSRNPATLVMTRNHRAREKFVRIFFLAGELFVFLVNFLVSFKQGGLPRRAARCSLKSGGGRPEKKVQACPLYYLAPSARHLLPSSRRPLTTSLLPLPIASNPLFGNFYTRFLRFLSIFRDF